MFGSLTTELPGYASASARFRASQGLPGIGPVQTLDPIALVETSTASSQYAATEREGYSWPWIALGAVGAVGLGIIAWRGMKR